MTAQKHSGRRHACAALALVLLLILSGPTAGAEKARFVTDMGGSTMHATHLALHIGSDWCRCAGTYVQVRQSPGSSIALGHLEQADSFTLLQLSGNWACVCVVYSAATSPDSWVGLTGWVNADYVECPCTRQEYQYGSMHALQHASVLKNKTNVRETTSGSSRVIALVNAGSLVTVISPYTFSDGRSWYSVRLSDGQRGFVRGDLVRLQGDYFYETDGSMAPAGGAGAAAADPEGSWYTAEEDGLSWGATPVPTERESETVLSGGGKTSGSVVQADRWSVDYSRFLHSAGYNSYFEYPVDEADVSVSLLDLTGDGQPELILHNEGRYMAESGDLVFTWNGSVRFVGNAGFRECFLRYDPSTQFLYCYDGNMDHYYTMRYVCYKGTILSDEVSGEPAGCVDVVRTPLARISELGL